MSQKRKTTSSAAQTQVTPKPPTEFQRGEEFIELYANNVRLETSVWDLKLIFGLLEQHLGPNTVVQHSSVTIPWAQVKLVRFFLTLLLIQHEARMGRVQIAKGLITEIPEDMPQELRDEGSLTEETWATLRKLYTDFLTENPEAAP